LPWLGVWRRAVEDETAAAKREHASSSIQRNDPHRLKLEVRPVLFGREARHQAAFVEEPENRQVAPQSSRRVVSHAVLDHLRLSIFRRRHYAVVLVWIIRLMRRHFRRDFLSLAVVVKDSLVILADDGFHFDGIAGHARTL